ncbi:NACHT, LRR and PYD domains-containing protein 12-like, partial [Astyanax mexicanus]|uniref:NACHT, LRR and PYD domains-containing protein 12-like n=1 Tax=Astyanax mexicanus TaxID=7994 RepID=UPI0020CAC6F9
WAPHTGPLQTSISAQTGGNIRAPVLHGNHITGPLTVIYNTHGGEDVSSSSTSTVQTCASGLTEDLLTVYKQKLGKTFQSINEGISQHGTSTLLNEIYTELYITEGGSGEVNNEHEVRQIETASRRPATQEKPINCNDLFKDKPVRTVLTKGVAGIGKTVSVQKFILDWAEGKANQDIHFIFPLPFRELNLMMKKNLSLMVLLHTFFSKVKELGTIDCDTYKILFIFDGLDECRLPLDFQKNESLWDVTESASVDVLLTNLIKGNLLPSALLWITTRPATAHHILPESVDLVTEIRGFSDAHKEEYFKKRISDQSLANSIITHIRSSRSLYIMCHIPVFCWIAATVLERVLGEAETGAIPKTLTQMFTHFLIFQIKHRNQKYQGKCDPDLQWTRKMILALGKLAFQKLEKGDLIFYEEDLRECGIDVSDVLVYSGVCTQIFRKEFVLHLGKVFSFVHLSVQEFLAALFAYLTFISKDRTEQLTLDLSVIFNQSTVSDFLKSAVDKALQSENGHFDLFLRFLLGLSLESNQTLLRGLLTQAESSSYSKEETVQYIKEKIRENPPSEQFINLFHCLNELNDQSLVKEVQTYVNRGDYFRLSAVSLSPAQWSALVFVLLNSEEELDEFFLQKYYPSDECILRLLPVIKASRNFRLSGCNLTERSCAILASALISKSSSLIELNMNDNELLQDSGVQLLSDGLNSSHCKLEKLEISRCSLTEKSCTALVSALSSNYSCLKELDLSHNEIHDSGVKLLCTGMANPHCKLEILKLENCNLTEKSCAALNSVLSLKSSSLRDLTLSQNKMLWDLGVKQLSDGLKNSHCKLENLALIDCNLTKESCAALASALRSSSLKELDLSYNKRLQISGVQLLSDGLKDPQCKLEKLRLVDCNITKESCAALASVLSSKYSSLKELDLSFNYMLLDVGVKQLSAGLNKPHCKLEKLELLYCNLTEKCCADLASYLSSNSNLKELCLAYNKLQDSGIKLLSAGLENPYNKLEILSLGSCNLSKESCAALVPVLSSNCSCLRELNMSDNKLVQDSGVKLLCHALDNPHSKLEKLFLRGCGLTKESCEALASVLSLSYSSLRDLDMSSNELLQDSGVKALSAGLENPHCKLIKLTLYKCSITEKGWAALASALKSNSSQLRELNLEDNEPGESGVELLKNPHCKLKKLQI